MCHGTLDYFSKNIFNILNYYSCKKNKPVKVIFRSQALKKGEGFFSNDRECVESVYLFSPPNKKLCMIHSNRHLNIMAIYVGIF